MRAEHKDTDAGKTDDDGRLVRCPDLFSEECPSQDGGKQRCREAEGDGVGHRREEIALREGCVDPEDTEGHDEGSLEPSGADPKGGRL